MSEIALCADFQAQLRVACIYAMPLLTKVAVNLWRRQCYTINGVVSVCACGSLASTAEHKYPAMYLKWLKITFKNIFTMQKLSKIAFALPEVNIIKPIFRPLILTKILMFYKLSIIAFALPEVNTAKQELRPMIVTKIIIFPNLTFIYLRWPKLAFKYIFMHQKCLRSGI